MKSLFHTSIFSFFVASLSSVQAGASGPGGVDGSKVDFPDNYFDYVYEEVPESYADLIKHEPKEMPWSVVARHLVQTQNIVEYDRQRYEGYHYKALGSFYVSCYDTRFLIYSKENIWESSLEIFLALWMPNQEGYPLTLRILGTHITDGDVEETFFRTDDCSIGVFTVFTKDEIPSLKSKTYFLNSSLSLAEECVEIGLEPGMSIIHF